MTRGVLSPILFMPSRDVIATSTKAYHTTIEVLRYRRGTGTMSFSGANLSIELATAHELLIYHTCRALIDAQSSLVAVHDSDARLASGERCSSDRDICH